MAHDGGAAAVVQGRWCKARVERWGGRRCLHPNPLLLLAHLHGLHLLRLGNLILEAHLLEFLNLRRFLLLPLCFHPLVVEPLLRLGHLLEGFLLLLSLLSLELHLG